MKKILTALVAAAVLTAAAVAVVAITGSVADAQEPPDPPAPRWQLEDSDEAPLGYQRGFRMGAQYGYLAGELWEDGFIDTDEIAGLPEGHPLTDPEGPAAAFLDDGKLTVEEHEQLRAECDQYEERAVWRAERWTDRDAFRAARQSNFEVRAELRAQHQEECAESDDCPYEALGPGFGGRGFRPGGPNV